jgi:hypothetical protein
LLQKIDRNEEHVFSTPLNYLSLNACKGAGSNANFHALRQPLIGILIPHGLNSDAGAGRFQARDCKISRTFKPPLENSRESDLSDVT